MESTFILKREDLNDDFLDSVKKLFSNSKKLQITITTSEDFGLLNHESPDLYFERLIKAAEDVKNNTNLVKISDAELDEMVLSRL